MRHISSTFCIAAAVLVTAVFIAPASAVLITVPNHSFESPDVVDGDFTDATIDDPAIPNWAFFGGDNGSITGGVWDPQDASYSGTTGNNAPLPNQLAAAGGQAGYIYLEQFNDASPQALGAQFTTAAGIATIAQNTRYTLTVALGRDKDFDTGDVTVELLVNNDSVTDQFIAAGSLIADTFTNVSASFDVNEGDPLIGGELKVRVRHSWAGAGVREVEFDNVRVETEVIPEPSGCFALMGFGLLASKRRR